MHQLRKWPVGFFLAASVASMPALAADIIVSAQDGKFVRVDGRATFPQPAPSDSLVVIDASTMQEVARLHLPQRVPFGVHACWLDTIKLETIAARAT